MGKRLDSGKLIAWRQRLAKLYSSGLSVLAFCRREGISPARFYYWSRRVREAGSAADIKRSDANSEVGRQSTQNTHAVGIAIGEYVKVRLPGDDRELISAVLASLQSSVAAAKSAGSFQRIELEHASAALRCS